MVISLLIILPIRYSIERVKPFNHLERNPEWVQELRNLQGKYGVKTVFINEEHAIEGMFYTDYIFYERTLNEQETESLHKQGYKVIIR